MPRQYRLYREPWLRAFPSCSNFLAYITAREQVEQGNLNAACAAYRKMSIMDAPDRAATLALIIENATPTPISTTTLPSRNDYVAPKIISPNPMLTRTTLKVVNCNNYIILRSEPDWDSFEHVVDADTSPMLKGEYRIG